VLQEGVGSSAVVFFNPLVQARLRGAFFPKYS